MINIISSLNILVEDLEPNKGQIQDVPKNPRFIRDNRFEKLKKSIEDNPEFLGARELIVFKQGKKYVILGGNMRYRAAVELGYKRLPCKVLPEDYTAEQLRAIVIKDNVSFGDNDFESLANEWDSIELEEWGMEVPSFNSEISADDFDTEFSLPDGDKAPFQQMTFTLADEQAEQIKNAISDIKQTQEYKYVETMGNENSNGNALYLIIMQWIQTRN